MKVSHVVWNLAGLGLPPLAALISIPPLLALLGAEGFGLLSLAWSVTALSGLFDLGLGRATTRAMADMKGRGEWGKAQPTVQTALRATWICGLLGGGLVLALAALDLPTWLKLKTTSAHQATWAVVLLAGCVPLQAAMATYRGISEGLQEFRGVSLVRMTVGCANFLLPWAVASCGVGIVGLIATLLLIRGGALTTFRSLARHHLAEQLGAARPDDSNPQPLRKLLNDGGWLSVSAIISPLLVQADRFLVATLLSTAAVSVYVLPFDMVTQLLVLVSAVATVAFPSFTTARGADPEQARTQFRRWLKRVGAGMALVCGVVAWLLPDFLTWWLGASLDPVSVTIGRLLCLGVWINALGAMWLAWLHAQGRYRATATLHLIELPLHVVALLLLLPTIGIAGAAMAWVLRVSLDTLCLIALGAGERDTHP